MSIKLSDVVVRLGADDPPASVASDTFTALTGVIGARVQGRSKSEAEITDFDDTQRAFVGTLADPGTLVLEMRRDFADALQNTLEATDMSSAGRTRNIQILYRDKNASPTTERTMDQVGELFSFEPNDNFDSSRSVTLEFRLSGAPTFS